MTPAEIRAAIMATPAALALVDAVRNDLSPAPDSEAIAAALSAALDLHASTPVGRGEIALALGIPAGPVFLYQLSSVATTPPAAGASAEQIAIFATAWQAWDSLSKGSLDVGNAAVRQAVDSFIGVLLTAEQAAAIKAMAAPRAMSEFDVRRAILADDGSLMV